MIARSEIEFGFAETSSQVEEIIDCGRSDLTNRDVCFAPHLGRLSEPRPSQKADIDGGFARQIGRYRISETVIQTTSATDFARWLPNWTTKCRGGIGSTGSSKSWTGRHVAFEFGTY